MPSVSEIDLAALLAPFAGACPAGDDPRADASAQSAYYRLRDARSEARDAERKADGDAAAAGASPQQWQAVRDLAVRILRDRAKDLEVATWLTEALVREDGISGLAAGATLLAELVERFWDDGLYPTPDEDGVATLVAPITGLNGVSGDGTLAQVLRKQVMFPLPDGGEMTFWLYAQAEDVEGIGDAPRKKQRLDAGAPVFATVERDAKAAGAAYFAARRDEIDAAIAAWDRMAAVLDAKAAGAAPSTSRVRDLLARFLASVMRYAPPRPAQAPAETLPADDAAPAPEAAGAGAPMTVAADRVMTREDMLVELAKIADYFRRSEPQSPLSLTLDEAIRRARLSWPELLEEVVANAETRNAMMVQLGIRPKPIG